MNRYLFLIGGNEDKKHDKEILNTICNLTQPKKIVIIPTASKNPIDSYYKYYDAFKDMDSNIICDIMDIREYSDIKKEIHKLENTDLIYFSGGDQVRLADILIDSDFLTTIKNNSFHIAGTSAGAAIMGEVTIYDSDSHIYAFDILHDLVIDTHFNNRDRYSRLENYLNKSHIKCGIGLDEDTGVIVKNNRFTVIGSGEVTVINRNKKSIYTKNMKFRI
jgi:cyanophycinase